MWVPRFKRSMERLEQYGVLPRFAAGNYACAALEPGVSGKWPIDRTFGTDHYRAADAVRGQPSLGGERLHQTIGAERHSVRRARDDVGDPADQRRDWFGDFGAIMRRIARLNLAHGNAGKGDASTRKFEHCSRRKAREA